MTKAPKVPQPLFYHKPYPLLNDRHAEAGLSPNNRYNFTANSNSVPINLQEFVSVAKTYPIVFAQNSLAEPIAVLGLGDGKNLFVNSKGEWEKEKYIPAYIRRYPFAFMPLSDDKLALCIDESADFFSKKAKPKDMKFFEDGKQTEFTKKALDFCNRYHRDQMITQQFSKTLKDMGLLSSKQITATFEGKQKPATLKGFDVVDEEKLLSLSAEKTKELQKLNYLPLIYFHVLSLSNFTTLSKMV